MDPDPAIFVIDLRDANKKLIKKKFAYYFLKVHLHQKVKKSHKIVGIKVFLLFLHDDRRIQIREAKKPVDPVDPDPQHW
jgi:hypothetical protein